MKDRNRKKYILPAVAGILVLAALIIMIAVPKNTGSKSKETDASASAAGSSVQTADPVFETNEDGDIILYADRLSSDQVSFLRVFENSRIELLARLGDDGKAKAALGTCQSCNGAPGAYYTQEEDHLKCNNCGLTFPLSVLDSPGGGCHPIMPDEEVLEYRGNNLLIHSEQLSAYEKLFASVADH